MGQQNEKVEIVQMNKRDYKIFPPKQRTSNSINTTAETNYLSHNKYTNNMKCERLHCKCPNEHVRKENVKLCNHCVSDVQPTIWKNNKLPYEKSDLHSKTGYQHSQYTSYPTYHEQRILQRQEPVYYYNAWALPIQKCYLDPLQLQAKNKMEESIQIKIERQKYDPPKYIPQKKIPQKKLESPKKQPPPLNFQNVDLHNRVQNLFLLPSDYIMTQ